jgi:hypothetical protein
MERKTIIGEVFEETFKLLDESVDMKIETLSRNDKIPVNCPKCNNALDKTYCRYEDSENDDATFDLKVHECPKCKTVYAYWIDYSYTDDWLANQMETPMPTENQSLEGKVKPILKQCAKAYLKSKSELENKNKDLNNLIQTKLPELYKAGLSLETINFARNKLTNYLRNNKPSPKGFTKLFAAAIFVTANGVTTDGGSLWKHRGEGITEEKLEEIFGVTRKTIRKWARTFP